MHSMRTEQVASAAAEATDKLVSHCRFVLTCSQYLVGIHVNWRGCSHGCAAAMRMLTKWCLTHYFPPMHELAGQEVMSDAICGLDASILRMLQ